MDAVIVATPLCPAGHLPHKGGDWLDAPASHFKQPQSKARRHHESISPLVGEMPGRAEGGMAPIINIEVLGMSHTPVPPRHRANAKRMRSAMSDAELKLWNELRAHRLMGLSFRRQVPIAGYIVDFACPTHRLIVEVDGSQHGNDADLRYDENRTRRLQQDGWIILRFWNDDVLKDIDNACLHIVRTIEEARP